jgi:RNA polymerase sigma factor (sigma-70 family)
MYKRHQPEYQLEKKELFEVIEKAVDLLKESRRQVIKLYLLGMSRNEISDFYGWSKDKVRNLLYRGLADLKKSLSNKGIKADLGET